MKSMLKIGRRAETTALAAIGVAAAAAVFASPAFAGADATFNTALNAFTGFLEGSGGKIITVLSLAGVRDRLHDAEPAQLLDQRHDLRISPARRDAPVPDP